MNKLLVPTVALLLSVPAFEQSVHKSHDTTGVKTAPSGANSSGQWEPSADASLAMGSDMGAKINSIVHSCAGAACRIYVPAGTYTITTPIVLASNIDLSCAGKEQAILNYIAASPSIGSASTTSKITALLTIPSGASYVKFHDCGLKGVTETPGKASSYNNTQAINVLGKNTSISNVSTAHFWAYTNSINMAGSYNTIENSSLEYGTFVVGGDGDHNIYRHNYISNHYSAAKMFERPAVHYWDGLNLEGASYATVSNNTVEDNGQSGIYLGGNGTVAHHNTIMSNTVRNNWNRGIDAGVTGDVTSSNGILSTVIDSNISIDNLADNIWVICNTGATISGNRSEYTTAYPNFFGAMATTSRSGIVVADICGSIAADVSKDVAASGNTAIDYLPSSFGLNFNLKATSAGNSFVKNSSNAATFVGSTINRSKNTYTEPVAVDDLSKPSLRKHQPR